MKEMPKQQLCKLTKDEIKSLLPNLARKLPLGQYICKKCARIAHDRELLCKPVDTRKFYQE